MSTTPGGGNPLRRLISQRQVEQERDDTAAAIGEEREQLWQSLLVGPVAELVPRWADGWAQLAMHLRAGDNAQAASELIRLDTLLHDLQRVCEAWRSARDRWYRERAGPWNRRYPETGGFSRMNPDHQPAWLFFWIRDACRLNVGEDAEDVGPVAIGSRVARWVEQAATGRPGVGHEAVYLLAMVGTPCGNEYNAAGKRVEIEQCVGGLSERAAIAEVCMILAAVVIPSPKIVERFFDANPSGEAVRLAEWILQVSQVEVGKGLLATFRQACPEPTPAAPATSPGEQAAPTPTNSQPLASPPVACTETQAEAGAAGKPPKRTTQRGEGREKLRAALTKHHKYADGSALNQNPIGNNELARLAGVEPSTASEFFKRAFKGHTKYRAACQDVTKLVAALKLLNDEFSPHDLYGRDPAGDSEDE